MKRKTLTIPINGKDLVFETGKIAKQANGCVLVHCNETTILSSVCSSSKASEDIDFLPLRVDYQSKFSSVGKTASGFIKREGKPSTHDILISRFIDRSIRPLFPDGYFNEVQILSYVYSYDGENIPDVLGICAASAALVISDIPFIKPIGAVRVGYIDNEFIINPTPKQLEDSKLDLVLAGSEDAILMIEGFCDFLSEDEVLTAIESGHTVIKEICRSLNKWREEIGKPKKTDTIAPISPELKKEVKEACQEDLIKSLKIADKNQREAELSQIKEKLNDKLFPENQIPKFLKRDVNLSLKKLSAQIMRKAVLENKKRIDGRKLDEIRPIDIEAGFLPRTHGSSLFTRGETQAIAVCTLGGETMAQRYEDLHGEGTHRFYLQYFFPPFSVGEVGRAGFPSRREIGHGNLAERALSLSLPKQEDFPYVIRLESNITESNGSSSMASVCGGCISLMDAGVPIKRPVSGIAMGLILEDENHIVLSDILGVEDALGDMDFKLTGDEDGITAFQMDIKIEGITKEIMKTALLQAKAGRKHILKKMLEVCPATKEKMSKHAPRIISFKVKPSQIGTVIGPGGKQIRAIIEETGVEININDEGVVNIASPDEEKMLRAKTIIEQLTAEMEVGKTYKGKISGIKPFGLFVEIYGKEGLCHISEISHTRIDNLFDLYKEGDELEVKVIDINDRGQVKLSHKILLDK
jgi:polyribonucleotide nucleotidyltransferase